MAEALVGGALLGAFFNVLFDKLASTQVRNFFYQSLIESLNRKLNTVEALLVDAENKEITNPKVKGWLFDLKCVCYDAELILDHIAAEKLRLSINGRFVDRVIYSFKVHRFPSKLKAIIKRLEEMVNESQTLGLNADLRSRGTHTSQVPQDRMTTSLVDESVICGRQEEKKRIIEMLVSKEETVASGSKAVRVVAIVGMGGIGKTTLAQLAYNDCRVKAHFDLQSWVFVSDAAFDIVRMTKTIILDIMRAEQDKTDHHSKEKMKSLEKSNNLNFIQGELSRKLQEHKRFLIVLDDVWNEKNEAWDLFSKPFCDGAHGSRIVVTTRSATVAYTMGAATQDIVNLEKLSDEDGWALFSRYAFRNDHDTSSSSLKVEIGKKIVGKCKGAPLALKVLGSMLSSIKETKQWQNVLDSSLWGLSRPTVEDEIFAPLRLSYRYLPSRVKRCFAYCSLFPKDYLFDKEKLVLLWIGEGFVMQPDNGRCIEEEGRDCFMELVARSFFTPHRTWDDRDGYRDGYLMHDLLHDVAESTFKGFFKRFEGETSSDTMIPKTTRHISITSIAGDDEIREINSSTGLDSIRSIVGVDGLDFARWVCGKLPQLHSLHVLSLAGAHSSALPDTIGNLRLLRYLDLSFTRIEELPAAVCTLYNLQVLICYDCERLRKLPNNIWKLASLCHLDLRGTDQHFQASFFSKIASKLERREFRGRQFLRGKLQLDLRIPEVREEHLGSDRIQFVELELSFSSKINPDRQLDMLSNLKHPASLTKLTVVRYDGMRFPNWLGDQSTTNLVEVELLFCRNCLLFPSLGQLPSLKRLRLKSLDKLTSLDGIGLQRLTSLEYLSMFDCPALQSLPEQGLPLSLNVLDISNLPKLTGLDGIGLQRLSSLGRLEIKDCPALQSLPEQGLPLSLKEFWISNLPKLTSLDGIGLQRLTLLEWLSIKDCPALQSLPEQGLPLSLENLLISKIPKLTSLDGIGLQRLTSLGRLEIKDCPALQSLPEQGLPLSLKMLHIVNLPKLTSLDGIGLQRLTSLERLEIKVCPALQSFPEQGLPLSLKKLSIYNLSRLTNFDGIGLERLTSLERLEIGNCPALQSLPEEGLPLSLKHLQMYKLLKLTGLDGIGLQRLTSLEILWIRDCPALQSLPEQGLPLSLKHLQIYKLLKLTGLDGIGLQRLTSLEILEIKVCPAFQSFPEQGLPLSLKKLSIYNLSRLTNFDGKGLERLTSLERLEIGNCPALQSLPEQGLPLSLKHLQIYKLLKLTGLNGIGLQRLTSLEILWIRDCPALQSLPQQGLPLSLKHLQIYNLPKLTSLDGIGLQRLTSLEWLSVKDCPALRSLPKLPKQCFADISGSPYLSQTRGFLSLCG